MKSANTIEVLASTSLKSTKNIKPESVKPLTVNNNDEESRAIIRKYNIHVQLCDGGNNTSYSDKILKRRVFFVLVNKDMII